MQDKKSAGEPVNLSRRRFLASVGVVLGGSVAGSGLLFSACTANDSAKTVTLTNEKPRYICPYDGKAFDTFEQLTQYISDNYPGQQPVTRFMSPYDNREFSSLQELKAYLDSMFTGLGSITLNVNGTMYTLQAKAYWSLSFVLREKLGLTGTKIGCNRGSCGACTVIIDGKAIVSCLVLAVEATGKHITTIEGISDSINLHPVQQAFVNNNAAQCGYCTPGFIMSAKALLDNNPAPSMDEVREVLSGHLCICGHTKKIVDAVLRHTQKRLKEMNELSVIGNPGNLDKQIVDIVTGKLDYAADNLPGKKLFVRVAGAKYAHARVKSIDTSKAVALEGVEAICTYEDCPVFSDTILYYGQEVAAIAAVDEDTAVRAIELIEVEYEVLTAVLDPDEAMKPGAPLVGTFPDRNCYPREESRGNIEKGFAEADIIINRTLGWTNYFQHGTLETCTAVASWTGDHLYIWTGSQNPFNQRSLIASAFKMPLAKVHLVSHGTGGGHGDKHDRDWSIVAAVLAKKAGCPVQFALSRAENFINRTHQFPVKATIKMGAKSDGTLTAIDSTFYGDACSNGWPLVVEANDVLKFTYKCPNGSFKNWTVATNKPRIGYWRCISHPQATYLAEIVIDMLAEKVGLNPLEFRLKNIVTPDTPDQDTGLPLASNGIRDILVQISEAVDWNRNWHKPGARILPDGKLHGIGICAHIDPHGTMARPVGATVNINRDGTALILDGISRASGGTNSAHCHIVAETLGVRYEDVMVGEWGNTDVCADGGFQGGSTRTITGGAAFHMAALDARNQLFEVASTMLNVPTDEIEAKDGRIYEKANPANFRSHAQVATRAPPPIVGRGYTWEKVLQRPIHGFPKGSPCEVRGVSGAAAEVAVDPETGEVEILKLINAVDTGKAIFWKGCEGQIEGGIELMIGQALFYEQILDQGTGATLNAGYIDHKWPTTLDLNSDRHEAIIIESDDACGPYGCKGIGEPSVSNYGAIANAVYNATGRWIGNPPITPAKILQALSDST
ncbi:MAG: hypothetical protein C4542_05380 [Dehalococcoidia bacterium]|nr:MAG: hypothetical protein C4542_05380 [Dehalococcoidia bacterium]